VPQHSSLVYSGYCRDCGKIHSLASELAIPHAFLLMGDLEQQRRLDFERMEADPALTTDWLYSDMRGKMFGVLVCTDAKGNEVVLKAFSSKYNGYRSVKGWVPPVADETLFEAEVEAGNQLLHPLTERISATEKSSPEHAPLIAERKAVSHAVLEKLLDLYNFTNFGGETRNIRQAFTGERIPIGTGDCCAPKLLQYAAMNGLTPVSLAEFYWGKESASGDRQQGEFYPSCMERCAPLLGFMLCGLLRQ
jgi:hypothetical protein